MGGARQQGHRSSLQDEVSAYILNFKLLQGSERLDVPWQSPATTDVIPAHAGIQYATAIRLSHCGLWILGRPIKPGDDSRCTVAFAQYCIERIKLLRRREYSSAARNTSGSNTGRSTST
jgi:hypothetical protein